MLTLAENLDIQSNRMSHFFKELKRRNVTKVAIAYAVVAWMAIEIAATTFPMLQLPQWAATFVTVLMIIGFPVALIFAWAFELTPEGLKKEKDLDRSQSISHITGRRLDFFIIAALSFALIFVVIDQYVLDQKPDHSTASKSFEPLLPVKMVTVELERSIAVLPFRNRSALAEDVYFVDGVHDEILTRLSKLSSLTKVISRTSTEQYRATTKHVSQIGQELGVAIILEGGVQRSGQQVRFNIQLIDAAADKHIWATTYNRELTAENVFEVQSDIVRTIVAALDAELTAKDNALLNFVPTKNTEAHNLYLRGQEMSKQHSFDSLRQADNYFRKATLLDPEYVQAWVAIADNRHKMLTAGSIDIGEYVAEARPALNRALQLNEQVAEVHAQLANLLWNVGDDEAAEVSIKRALEIASRNSSSLIVYAQHLRRSDRPQEAIPLLARALEDDPLSVQILYELGDSEMRAGRPEQNVIYAERILEIDPSSIGGHIGLQQAYLWMGRFDLLWPSTINALSLDTEDFERWAFLGLVSNTLGKPEWGERYFDRADIFGRDKTVTLKFLAQVLVQHDRKEEAIAMAHRALKAGLGDRWLSHGVFLRLVRDEALQSGDFDEALNWYRGRHPELFVAKPKIGIRNVNAAADLTMLLQRSGDLAAAKLLIDTGLSWFREIPPSSLNGYLTNIANVEFLALNADRKAALIALQKAVDGGWRWAWQWYMSNENLALLKNRPEFQAIIRQLENDMVTQREAIQALPPLGKFDLRFEQTE